MNDTFEIEGLKGAHSLKGVLPVAGAKNGALPTLASTLLFEDSVTLTNIPEIEDIDRMSELLESIGAQVEKGKNSLKVSNQKNIITTVPNENATKFRASVVVAGPILARFGKVTFPHPGGDLIGARPINLFLEGFIKMGATLNKRGDKYELTSNGKKLSGAHIFLREQSVGATQGIMLAACLATGTTLISNAAQEPEIKHLADYLNKCGADIEGAGTSTIKIEGGKLLLANGLKYKNLPDRIEAGTYVILAVLAGQEITVTNCVPEHIRSLLETISLLSNAKLTIKNNSIIIQNSKAIMNKSVNIKTHEYPGFPTDLQAPMAVLLTQAHGDSLIFETIFDKRLEYTELLRHMGANIKLLDQHRALISGPTKLVGRELSGPDIRAGLALVLAAIIAKGKSVIHNVYAIDRGYEHIEKRLANIGVKIVRK